MTISGQLTVQAIMLIPPLVGYSRIALEFDRKERKRQRKTELLKLLIKEINRQYTVTIFFDHLPPPRRLPTALSVAN